MPPRAGKSANASGTLCQGDESASVGNGTSTFVASWRFSGSSEFLRLIFCNGDSGGTFIDEDLAGRFRGVPALEAPPFILFRGERKPSPPPPPGTPPASAVDR